MAHPERMKQKPAATAEVPLAFAFGVGHSWYSPDRKIMASVGHDGRLLVIVNGGPLYLYPFAHEETKGKNGDRPGK